MRIVNRLVLRVAIVVCAACLLPLLSLPFSATARIAQAATHATNTAAPVKIMPLGDSITYGTNSSNGGGYRLSLWNDLISQGATVNFVGSQQSGPENFDADNEGHPGWRIDQIATNIVNWLTTYQPQIILLHIGTNDIIQNYQVPDAPTRLSQLIQQITTTLPSATLFVAQIIPLNSSLNTEVVTYNATIPGIVQAAGSHVHLVDMYDAVSPTLLPDNIHPNDAGYGLMANVWHSALLPFLHLNSQSSTFVTNFANGLPQPTSSNVGDTGIYPAGGIENVSGICCGLSGPEVGTRNESAHSGTTALLYSGNATNASGPDFAYLVGFDVSGLHLTVGASSTLSYWIYPENSSSSAPGAALTSGNNSSCVAIDLIFSDGTNLRDSGATDQHGNRIHPAYQCGHLTMNAWNQIIVNLGAFVNGKTIMRLDVGYDQPNSTGGYRGYIDDLAITPNTALNNVGIADDSQQSAASFDTSGFSYSAEALASQGYTPGALVTVNGSTYIWPNVTTGANDNIVAMGQTLQVSAQPGAAQISFLGAATNGPTTGTVTITYTDGTTQTASTGFTDWTRNGGAASLSYGNIVACTMSYRNSKAGVSQQITTDVFATVPISLNTSKQVASIQLPSSVNQGVLHIFAWAIV